MISSVLTYGSVSGVGLVRVQVVMTHFGSVECRDSDCPSQQSPGADQNMLHKHGSSGDSRRLGALDVLMTYIRATSATLKTQHNTFSVNKSILTEKNQQTQT